MLVSADSIGAPHGSRGTVTTIIIVTESTGLLTILGSNVGPPTEILSTVDSLVLTVGIGNGSGTVIVLRRSVGGGSIGVAVTLSSFGEGRVAGVSEKTTVAVSSSELDETVISPAGSPGVLYQNKLGGVSDGGDSVVGSSTAGTVPDDSSSVLLEVVGNLESNSKSTINKSLDVVGLTTGDIVVAGDLGRDHGVLLAASLAGAISSLVDIVGSGSQSATVLFGVVVTVTRPSTFASVSPIVDTVQVLLLGEVPQNSRGNLVSGLQTSDGSEGPARSTRSLVLDLGDSSQVGPKDLLGGGESTVLQSRGVGGPVGDVESKVLLLLSLSHGREEVEPKDGGVTVLVVVDNLLSTLSEQPEPHPILRAGIVESLGGLEGSVELEGFLVALQDSPESILGSEDCSK